MRGFKVHFGIRRTSADEWSPRVVKVIIEVDPEDSDERQKQDAKKAAEYKLRESADYRLNGGQYEFRTVEKW